MNDFKGFVKIEIDWGRFPGLVRYKNNVTMLGGTVPVYCKKASEKPITCRILTSSFGEDNMMVLSDACLLSVFVCRITRKRSPSNISQVTCASYNISYVQSSRLCASRASFIQLEPKSQNKACLPKILHFERYFF